MAKNPAMFGDFVKEKRLKKDISLREFCRLLPTDASNWSKVERGLLPPPQDEGRLKRIADILGIDTISDEFMELKDKAAIASGIIPKDILSDKEVLDSLPIFFRTVRSEKPTSKDLDLLIEKMKKGV